MGPASVVLDLMVLLATDFSYLKVGDSIAFQMVTVNFGRPLFAYLAQRLVQMTVMIRACALTPLASVSLASLDWIAQVLSA